MIEREKQIRELVKRVTAPESKVSREFSLLSVDATEFLLMQLDAARAGQNFSREECSLILEMVDTRSYFDDARHAVYNKLKGIAA